MKYICFYLFALVCYTKILAQIPIGYNHLPNGNQVIGNYHTFLNNEFGCVNISLDNDNYEKGTLKLKNFELIKNTYLNFNSLKLKEKDNLEDYPRVKKHKIKDVEYFKLGLDSFFVVNKILTNDVVIDKHSIVKHIAIFDSINYGQYYKYNFNNTLNEKFFVEKSNKDKNWKRVYLKEEPIKKAHFFGYAKFVDKKELTEEEFLNTIKEIQYSKNAEKKSNLF